MATHRPRRSSARATWLKLVHQWHWISAAVSLIGMLGFAVTGITLNHAQQIPATPQTQRVQVRLPDTLLAAVLPGVDEPAEARLPLVVSQWLEEQLGLAVGGRTAEWSEDELYLSLPRPGGDGWLSIDRTTGEVEYETTDRGWIAYFNDLHKGRHTGVAWSAFLDLFAIACVLFCITGLFLLQLHAAKRRGTWPIVVTGFVLPLLLALLFIH